MNTSITRRFLVGGDLPKWNLRSADYIGLGFLLLVAEELWHRPKVWYSWGGALAIGVAFLWAGDTFPHLWKRMRGKTDDPPVAATPQHNVQCLGVRTGDRAADIGFVNVEIPNREIISFHQARLKIRYSLAGNQIETVFPARWIGSDDAEISVEFVPQYAVLAVYIGNEWYGVEIKESRRKLKSLPTAELRIEATLIGEGNLSIVPLTGSLALRKDGTASFSKEL